MSVLVFDQQASIHFQEVRSVLIRIPEVIQRIRSVQEVLDQRGVALDLSNFIASDNDTFLTNYRKKEFAGVVIQLGLYDRFTRFFDIPSKLIGVVNASSAVHVILGQMTISELVEKTFFQQTSKSTQALPGLPVLTGIEIPRFGVFKLLSQEPNLENTADIKLLLGQLAREESGEVYEVGVGVDEGLKGTLELDPHLSWMWSQISPPHLRASAN